MRDAAPARWRRRRVTPRAPLLLLAAALLAALAAPAASARVLPGGLASPAAAGAATGTPKAGAKPAAPAPKVAPKQAAPAPKAAPRQAAPAPGSILHIAHVNDVHNRIQQTSPSGAACGAASQLCLGGWARISTAVASARAEAARAKAPFLFLDIGDEFDGTLWDIVYRGMATARIQNMVQPDAMTLGNHEFSFPAPYLAAYIKNLTAPMLGACNVDTSAEPALRGLIKKWVVYKTGGYKVAALGWLTPDTKYLELNSGNVTFGDVIPSVRACVADLKRAHPDVDLIIGMSHTGYTNDLETAKAIPELDIILGGHSHTFLNIPSAAGPIFDLTKNATAADCVDKAACDKPSGTFPTYVKTQLCASAGGVKTCTPKQIPVVQAYYASKYMGHLKIDLATKKLLHAQPLLLGGPKSSRPVKEDPSVLAAIRELAGPVEQLEGKVIGSVNATLVAGNVARQMETNFGDYMASLVARSAGAAFEAKYGPVDVGIFGGGGIRMDIEAGDVTYGYVLSAMPFGNTLGVKAASAADVKAALAGGISRLKENSGRFPQVHGLRYWHRGTDLLAAALLFPNGTTSDLEDGKTYNVASNSYILSGGDGYTTFAKAPFLMPSGPTMDELMAADLEEMAPGSIAIPDPTKERRIINCAAAYVDCGNPEVYRPCCLD
ncbi:MAG: Metallo-dependent phosphatase-like protein [Monoraphidium minutum]|nr:MAG: Metallo-dependent phosphatase-like protein [Monoraphidium minutum]